MWGPGVDAVTNVARVKPGRRGGGVIEYRDSLELLKLLKIFDTSKDIKGLKKGIPTK